MRGRAPTNKALRGPGENKTVEVVIPPRPLGKGERQKLKKAMESSGIGSEVRVLDE